MIENFLSENNCIISNKIIKPNVTPPSPVSPYITFADPVVKQICVENWGSDGEITYEQAEAVVDLGTAFKYNTQITSFNELKCFGINSISDEAFYGCTGLTSITIPSYVTIIGADAFSGCVGLTSVTCNNLIPPNLYSNSFFDCINITNIYVPAESVDAYKTAENWSAYADIITAIINPV